MGFAKLNPSYSLLTPSGVLTLPTRQAMMLAERVPAS